jgi:predicted O-methyltransferase YrrM
MNISETRTNNIYNIRSLAAYLEADEKILLGYYDELLDDHEFLKDINDRIRFTREKYEFKKGIFNMLDIDTIDWFAFERVLIYVLIRFIKPENVLETGVYYGGNSAFALRALDKNKKGKITSIDFPDYEIRESNSDSTRHSLVGDTELYTPNLRPGFMVPLRLKERWNLIEGDSLAIIPNLDIQFDMYIHDSDHSMQFLLKEMELAWNKLSENAIFLVDDIDWSNAFYTFVAAKRLYPVLFTDNGKDNLRVRTGVVSKKQIRNSNPTFT